MFHRQIVNAAPHVGVECAAVFLAGPMTPAGRDFRVGNERIFRFFEALVGLSLPVARLDIALEFFGVG